MRTWTYTHPVLGHEITVSPAPNGAVAIEVVDDPGAPTVYPATIRVPVSAIPDLIAALQTAADAV